MADEVYEGAIGIDLGKTVRSLRLGVCSSWTKVPRIHVLPTMREQMSRSVRRILLQHEEELTCCSLVANEQGSFTTPSFVSFTDEERLIGESAKNQAAMNPANTIFDIK